MVAVTDLALVVIFGARWMIDWTTPGLYDTDSVIRYALSSVTFPGWGADEEWLLAPNIERFRAGILARIAVFMLAHLWVVDQFVRRAGAEGRWRAARTGAWALGPLVGALAGLATVAPAAFDMSVTAEVREVLRDVAVSSLEDGAYWGLFAGAVCAVTLTVALAGSEERDDPTVFGIGPDEPFTVRQVRGMLVSALWVAVPGFAAYSVLVFVLGGPLLASHLPRAGPSWAELLHYVRYVAGDPELTTMYSYAPVAAIPAYLYLLFLFLVLGAIAVLRAAPLRGLGVGWYAVTWALLGYVGCVATLRTVANILSDPADFGGRLGPIAAVLVREFVTELPHAAAYTALLGWVPAVAMVVAARIHRDSYPRAPGPS